MRSPIDTRVPGVRPVEINPLTGLASAFDGPCRRFDGHF